MSTNASDPSLDRERFARCWQAIGAVHDQAFDELDARLAEPHRTHHSARHVAECLDWLDEIAELAERPAELEIAIFFHDAIYEPMAGDNEARSVDLLRQLAGEAGVPREIVGRIGALIESTVGHDVVDGDAALLSDVDLAILGASPSRFARYERDIRREYEAVEPKQYRAGRARVFRAFLDRPAIYRSALMRDRLEAQARANLTGALAALAAQPGEE